MRRIKNHAFHSIYTDNSSRKCTDVLWTLISALFAIAMFVAANIMWNPANFYKNYASYYGQSNNQFCENNQLLLYEDPTNLQKYQCIKSCPQWYTNVKGLCLPNNEERRQNYLDNPQIAVMIYGSQFYKVLLYTTIIAISFGALNLSIVFFCPRFSAKFSFIWCLLLLLAVGILLLVLYDRFWRQVTLLKILVSLVCFFICVLIIIMIWLYSNQIKIYGIFLDYAVSYLNRNPQTFLYIPLFLILTLGLVALIVWQHVCYASKMGSSRNLFNMNTGVWGILNILEFIWGIQFLRDAFNFCVSGNFVDWFFKQKQNGCSSSLKRLICKNWGSVVAGSFLNAFFQIPNLIFQLFRCHPNTQCTRAGNKCYQSCNCCSSLFDLIRTDSYSFINISGENYCTSSQYCRELCDNSQMFVGMQSPMKHYRLMMHVTYISAAFLISWFIQRYLMEFYGIWNSALVIVVSLLCVTWFINIYSDIGEAVQTCFLSEREIQGDYGKMIGVDPQFRDDFYHHEKRARKDGNC